MNDREYKIGLERSKSYVSLSILFNVLFKLTTNNNIGQKLHKQFIKQLSRSEQRKRFALNVFFKLTTNNNIR